MLDVGSGSAIFDGLFAGTGRQAYEETVWEKAVVVYARGRLTNTSEQAKSARLASPAVVVACLAAARCCGRFAVCPEPSSGLSRDAVACVDAVYRPCLKAKPFAPVCPTLS